MPTSPLDLIVQAVVLVICGALFYGLYLVMKDRDEARHRRRLCADLDRVDRRIEECLEAADRNLLPIKVPTLMEGEETEVVLLNPLRNTLVVGGLKEADLDEYEVWDGELGIFEEDWAATGTGWPTLRRRWNKARAYLESLWDGSWQNPDKEDLAELRAEFLNIEARAVDAAQLLVQLRDENEQLVRGFC